MTSYDAARADWRTLYSWVRWAATHEMPPEGRSYWHPDALGAVAAAGAVKAGARAGFCLRHAARAARTTPEIGWFGFDAQITQRRPGHYAREAVLKRRIPSGVIFPDEVPTWEAPTR